MFGSSKLICGSCGSADKPVLKTKGNILIEIILWLAFIVPGLIYSIWRQSTKFKTCRICESTDLIPLKSPKGQEMANKYGS